MNQFDQVALYKFNPAEVKNNSFLKDQPCDKQISSNNELEFMKEIKLFKFHDKQPMNISLLNFKLNKRSNDEFTLNNLFSGLEHQKNDLDDTNLKYESIFDDLKISNSPKCNSFYFSNSSPSPKLFFPSLIPSSDKKNLLSSQNENKFFKIDNKNPFFPQLELDQYEKNYNLDQDPNKKDKKKISDNHQIQNCLTYKKKISTNNPQIYSFNELNIQKSSQNSVTNIVDKKSNLPLKPIIPKYSFMNENKSDQNNKFYFQNINVNFFNHDSKQIYQSFSKISEKSLSTDINQDFDMFQMFSNNDKYEPSLENKKKILKKIRIKACELNEYPKYRDYLTLYIVFLNIFMTGSYPQNISKLSFEEKQILKTLIERKYKKKSPKQ